ncbi:MAG: hypothetical protein KatS3mg023_3840 [Armatimonadota bacterium]|nr:MAG: hypothetical protein KatS3mg023_3840 [Armatimonadota bacterium]
MTVKAIDPNGLVRDIRSDSSGNLSTTLGTGLAGEDLDADIIRTAATGQVTWVTNTTSQQIIKSSPGKLLRIVVGSASAAASITINSGESTTLATINVPQTSTTVIYELGFDHSTDIRVTPSSTGLSFAVVWR